MIRSLRPASISRLALYYVLLATSSGCTTLPATTPLVVGEQRVVAHGVPAPPVSDRRLGTR